MIELINIKNSEKVQQKAIDSLKQICEKLTMTDMGNRVLTFIIGLSHDENPTNKFLSI